MKRFRGEMFVIQRRLVNVITRRSETDITKLCAVCGAGSALSTHDNPKTLRLPTARQPLPHTGRYHGYCQNRNYTISRHVSSSDSSSGGSSSSSGDSKLDAHNALKEAVKELSQGTAAPMSYSPVSTLQLWNKQPLESLSVEELEELGRALFEGLDGLEVDLPKAVAVWSEGANRGSIESKYSRAVCLREGRGGPIDAATAFQEMLELADEHNYHLAHYAVGIMLSAGEGIEKDDARAFHYFKQAAKGGVTPALHNMGNAYAYGHGVPQNETNALRCYEAAVEAGDPAAKFTLGTWLYSGREGIVPADRERSFQLQLDAANAGHPFAMFNTGVAYMEGSGGDDSSSSSTRKPDLTLALEWFEKAAERRVLQAAVNASNMYRNGDGVNQDLVKARALLEPFANGNNSDPLAEQLIEQIDEMTK